MSTRLLLSILFTLFITSNVLAEVEIKRDYAGNVLSIHNVQSTPFKAMASRGGTAREVADDFVREYASAFGIASFEDELQVTEEKVDKTGTYHITYSQFYQGYPVLSAELIAHIGADLAVKSLSGRILDVTGLRLSRRVSFDNAYEVAERYWYENVTTEYAPVLVENDENIFIYDGNFSAGRPTNDPKLAYIFQLKSEDAGALFNFIIDANNGNIIDAFNPSKRLYRKILDCSLETGTYGLCKLGYVDGDGITYGRSENMAPVGRNPYVSDKYTTDDAYDFIGHIINMYKDYFGINGSNGYGGTYRDTDTVAVELYRKARLCGNYEGALSCPGNIGAMCGIDNTIEICEGYLTPDIFGHEYAHAVSQGVEALDTDRGCRGAISESFSDVMGEMFEEYYNKMIGKDNTDPDWIFGGEISETGFRNIIRPITTAAPDNFCGSYATNFCIEENVHMAGVVITRIFYYLSEGGVFEPDPNDEYDIFMYNGCNVKAIGRDKAAQIYYHYIKNYLTSSESYPLVGEHIVEACRDLYPTGSTCEWVQIAYNSSRLDQPGRNCSNYSDYNTACVDPVCSLCPNGKQVEGYCGCDSPEPSDEDAALLGKECTVGSEGCEATGVYICDGQGGITCDADISGCGSCLNESRFQKASVVTTVPVVDVASADLNNDGKDDLIIAKANGEITFLDKTLTVGSPKYVFAKDLNGNGKNDIIVISQERDITIVTSFMNLGGTNFKYAKSTRVSTTISDVFFSDINNDGKLDLMLLEQNDSVLKLFSGDGEGGFSLTKNVETRPSSGPPVNDTMLYKHNYVRSERSKYLFQKSELLSNITSYVSMNHFYGNGSIRYDDEDLIEFRLADLNQDGYSDMVLGFSDATVGIVLSDESSPQYINLKAPVKGIALTDYNNDGFLDIALANEDGVELFINDLNNPNCPFFCGERYSKGIELGRSNSISLTDLNGDGNEDLVLLGNELQVLIGEANGNFASGKSYQVSANAITSADFNGDGAIDLALSDGRNVAVLINDGNGDLLEPLFYKSSDGSSSQFISMPKLNANKGGYAIKAGDIDGDGVLDIATVNQLDDTISVFIGNGDGSFNDAETVAVGRAPEAIAIGDIDGDSKGEIIVANRFANSLSIIRKKRIGGYSTTNYETERNVDSIDLADLDNDGKLDIIAGIVGGYLVYYGDLLTSPVEIKAPNGQNLVKVIDFDKDGKLDIISFNTRGILTKVLGKGGRQFKNPELYSVGSDLSSVVYKDLNNDGLMDLIAADSGKVFSFFGSDSCQDYETSNVVAFVPNGTVKALESGAMVLPEGCILREKDVHVLVTPVPTLHRTPKPTPDPTPKATSTPNVTPTARPTVTPEEELPTVSPTPLPICYDTDGGSKPKIKGQVKFKKKRYNDKCLNKKRLQEWFCTKKLKAKKKVVKCKGMCKKGRCVAKKSKGR